MAADKQALVASKTNLEYQQLIMKQAIARNLNDPQLSNAPVIPTDRVSLDRLPEEDPPIEDLVRQAYASNPQIEQAVLQMKNNEITIKAFKNLLPTGRCDMPSMVDRRGGASRIQLFSAISLRVLHVPRGSFLLVE